MIRRAMLQRVGLASLAMLLAFSPAVASNASSDGQGPSQCTTCEFVIDWNPTLDCNSPFSSADALQQCVLASGPAGCGGNFPEEPEWPSGIGDDPPYPQVPEPNPPTGEDGCFIQHETGNYVVFPQTPPVSLDIFREDLTEVDRLHFVEDYPEVTWIEVTIDRSDLYARIGEITGSPTSGQIVVILNGRTVSVDTDDYNTANHVTRALVNAIRAADFDVDHKSLYIDVTRDNVSRGGVTQVRLESTDPGIVRSEIALEPWPLPEIPVLEGPNAL